MHFSIFVMITYLSLAGTSSTTTKLHGNAERDHTSYEGDIGQLAYRSN